MRQSKTQIKTTGRRALKYIVVGLLAGVLLSPAQADEKPAQADERAEPEYRTDSVRGKIVWLAEALKSEFGITTVDEVSENLLAILTTDGQVLPILENLRGRAFRKDERLRKMDVELLVRRYDKQPMLQVVRIFELDSNKNGDEKYEVDYWCDVCAITMFEDGPCACCQDHNRIRKRVVGKDGKAGAEVENE